MIPYQKEKIINAIFYFAVNHILNAKQPLYQTFLYKYLAFLDFISIKETGEPVLGLHYRALARGPAPEEIYNSNEYKKTDLYSFHESNKKTTIIPKQNEKFNEDYFSRYELNIMSNLIEIYAKHYITTNEISDASHEKINSWKKTWKKTPSKFMKYIDEFEKNPLLKSQESLSLAEEHFLTYSAINNID